MDWEELTPLRHVPDRQADQPEASGENGHDEVKENLEDSHGNVSFRGIGKMLGTILGIPDVLTFFIVSVNEVKNLFLGRNTTKSILQGLDYALDTSINCIHDC